MKKFFYIPKLNLLIYDFIAFFVAIFVLFLSKDYDFLGFYYRYNFPVAMIMLLWYVFGYFCQKYRPMRDSRYRRSATRIFVTLIFTAIVTLLLAAYYPKFLFSVLQTSMLLTAVFLLNIMLAAVVHMICYATYLDEEPLNFEPREPVAVLQNSYRLDDATIQATYNGIAEQTSPEILQYLQQNAHLESSNTLVISTAQLFNYNAIQSFRYDVIINLERLNHIRGINKMFSIANTKLPDDGRVVFCFESKSAYKKRLLAKWPPVIRWFFYCCDFFWHRICSQLLLTNRLYYDLTQGNRRVLSTTEVYGRLYFCGFEVVDTQFISGLTVVVAKRVTQSNFKIKKRYGPLIKLNRIGKNGKYIMVYKLRTMHPYAEYLQGYIYDKNHLQEGGKIKDDVRVTTLGRLARKYWLDELPMFINFFKGDMKLVGVRPLSKQYYNLYSKELQEKRIQFKPGLLPPFYVDMPKTLPEIEASEMRYLTMCEKRGCFVTDSIYFWRIIHTILFKHVHSN